MKSEQEMTAALMEFARTGDRITLDLAPYEAFVVMSQMQLALRHPANDGAGRLVATDIIGRLIDEIAPEAGPLRDLCDAGFDPSKDS